MPDITTTVQLSDSLRAQYESDYSLGAGQMRLYDQISEPVPGDLPMGAITKGSSVVIPFLSGLDLATDAISETVDINPSTFVDTTTSLSWTSLANYAKISEKFDNSAYTNFGEMAFKRNGENMMKSVEVIAQNAAVDCALVQYGSHGSRSTLDAGTADDLLNMTMFAKAGTVLNTHRGQQFDSLTGLNGVAIVNTFAWADFAQTDAKWIAAAEYQDKSMILNWEAGEVLGFKVLVSPYAKVFWGAGAANASAVATTLGSAASPLDKTITVAASSNIHAGDMLMIGTIESSSTYYPMNEFVTVITQSSNTIGIVGKGDNGGLLFSHASGATVSNADSVAAITFAGKGSLKKLFDVNTGEFGEIVGPYRDGAVKQWINLGWKWYGNYGRVAENQILRQECALGVNA